MVITLIFSNLEVPNNKLLIMIAEDKVTESFVSQTIFARNLRKKSERMPFHRAKPMGKRPKGATARGECRMRRS